MLVSGVANVDESRAKTGFVSNGRNKGLGFDLQVVAVRRRFAKRIRGVKI